MHAFLDDLKKIDVSGKDAVTLYNEISELAMREVAHQITPPAKRNAYYLSV